MKAPLPPRGLLLLFLLSLVFSFLAFFTAYQQDVARVSSLGQLAWAHLSYAEELKDDMAVIDWSKNLENLEDIRAFQVTSNSKVIAEGGNRNCLPTTSAPGVTYRFPSDWNFQTIASKGPLSPMEFTLVLHSGPSPFLLGLFSFFASWVVGYGTAFLSHPTPAPSSKKILVPYDPHDSQAPLPSAVRPAIGPSTDSTARKEACFFIDKNYVIRQASAEVAGCLQKKVEELLGRHLIDLAPDPLLIQAFEKGTETKILKPFPAYPDVSATVKPQPDGYLLILELPHASNPL
jgi:hypothetical protein